jgi:hypothetical protein
LLIVDCQLLSRSHTTSASPKSTIQNHQSPIINALRVALNLALRPTRRRRLTSRITNVDYGRDEGWDQGLPVPLHHIQPRSDPPSAGSLELGAGGGDVDQHWYAMGPRFDASVDLQWPFSTRDSASGPDLVGTPLPRVPDIRCCTGARIRLRRDIHRGIPGNARERIPTRLESAVGCCFARKTHSMLSCMDALAQSLAQHARQRVRTCAW